jgi:hyperosmotically inducible periplasmic protein
MNQVARLSCSLTFLLLALAGATPVKGQAVSASKPATLDEKSALSREIHHQLQVLPFYSVFDHIAFTINGTMVTLTGQVLRPTLKGNAEGAVKSLEGVTVVVNHIELLPASTSDDELRRGIYRAVYENPALAHYAAQTVPSIHIIVKNGGVTLEGNVESFADSSLAGARTSSVAKVLSVKNNLVVLPRPSARQ